MINKIKIHIPINTPEQIVVRDEIAKILAKESKAVILTLQELVKIVDGEPKRFSMSVINIYQEKLTDEDLEDFKSLINIIAFKIGDSVILEIMRESVYLGTANP